VKKGKLAMKTTQVDITPSQLLSITETYKLLGKGYSRPNVMRLIRRGEWIEGVHFIDDAARNAKQRSIKVNIPAVMKWRATPAGMR
jgi:rRNA processing protein Krr1/Pno1